MSDQAREHIKHLALPWHLKSVAFLIADYHSTREKCAWPSLHRLAEIMGKDDPRNVRRLLNDPLLREVIRYEPGSGRKKSIFRFLQLESRGVTGDPSEGSREGLREGSRAIHAIRKEPRTMNPPKSPNPDEPQVFRSAEYVDAEVDADPDSEGAAQRFQEWVEQYFRLAGYQTQPEVWVTDRGDGKPGRIDIVAWRGSEVILIECDRGSPREKSIAKLQNFPRKLRDAEQLALWSGMAVKRWIILREPINAWREKQAFEDVIRKPCRFERCDGSGFMPSYSTPGQMQPCECREAS